MGAEPGGLVQRFQYQFFALLTLTLCFANLHAAPQANKANNLANAKSEFLRRASSQPVAWVTFGPSAFALARQTAKPLLIEIGASWCPFCAAMDNDSYSNPQLATFLNDHYVAVRVDYDAQPELAHRLELAQARVGGLICGEQWMTLARMASRRALSCSRVAQRQRNGTASQQALRF
jgi:thiol:disulfide interchange protein